MPTRLALRLTPILVLLFLLAGCAMQPRFEEPTFRVTAVEPLALGLGEQQWRLRLRIDNPNSVALPVRALRYHMSLADMDFASGTKADGFTIAANESTVLDLDVTTHLIQSLPRFISLLDGSASDVTYRLTGDVEYGRFFRGTRQFTQEGRLQL